MRGRDPPDGPWICRRLIYDPSEWEIEEDEAISRMKTDELDRLVAAGRIKEIDREHVRFIIRTIVQATTEWKSAGDGGTGAIPWIRIHSPPPCATPNA
jgi:hypothetical protein